MITMEVFSLIVYLVKIRLNSNLITRIWENKNQEPIYMGPQLEFPIILSEDEIDSIRKDLSNSINIGFIKKIFKKPFP